MGVESNSLFYFPKLLPRENKKIKNAIRMLIASTWNIVFFHLNDHCVSVDGKFPAYVAAVGFLVLLRI